MGGKEIKEKPMREETIGTFISGLPERKVKTLKWTTEQTREKLGC